MLACYGTEEHTGQKGAHRTQLGMFHPAVIAIQPGMYSHG